MKRGAVRQAIALAVLALFSAQALAASPAAPVQGYTSMRTCSITIVAVSSTGQGVTGNLTVTVASPGRGRVYISTSPASEVDTQGSARLAAFAASLLSEKAREKVRAAHLASAGLSFAGVAIALGYG